MGSHGGGTAEGQREILAGYGITEEMMGCPIRASMETVVVCEAAEGFPVHFDKHAWEADHVVVCNRVKPHTHFVGEIESGLMKMMLIGLGKHNGAKIYHRAIMDFSFAQIVRSVAKEVLDKCGVIAGVALVENQLDKTGKVAAVQPHELEDREKELLVEAKRMMPTIPFEDVDYWRLTKLAKTSVDLAWIPIPLEENTMIIKRARERRRECDLWLWRGLTAATHGNATGLGMSEFCRSRVTREVDKEITRINCITGGHVTAAMAPLDYETDREIVDVVLQSCGLTPPENIRFVWIRNTLDVAEFICSEAYWDQVQSRG